MEAFSTLLKDWNRSSNERAKLQHAYIGLVVTVVVLAGLVTLLNPSLGHMIISFAGFLFLAFIANSIIWALLKSFVIDHLSTKRSTK
ncbi:MAG: hypothetical protein WBP12_02005 [Candidatus Saccharimonas sp.]